MLGIVSRGHMCAQHPSPVGLRPARPRFLSLCDTPARVCSAEIVIRMQRQKPQQCDLNRLCTNTAVKDKRQREINQHVAERDKKRIQ